MMDFLTMFFFEQLKWVSVVKAQVKDNITTLTLSFLKKN